MGQAEAAVIELDEAPCELLLRCRDREVDKRGPIWNTGSRNLHGNVPPQRKNARRAVSWRKKAEQFQAKEEMVTGTTETNVGGALTYEAVGVLGAGAAAGALAVAAVADVRAEAASVALLRTHRLRHCERGEGGRKRGVCDSNRLKPGS